MKLRIIFSRYMRLPISVVQTISALFLLFCIFTPTFATSELIGYQGQYIPENRWTSGWGTRVYPQTPPYLSTFHEALRWTKDTNRTREYNGRPVADDLVLYAQGLDQYGRAVWYYSQRLASYPAPQIVSDLDNPAFNCSLFPIGDAGSKMSPFDRAGFGHVTYGPLDTFDDVTHIEKARLNSCQPTDDNGNKWQLYSFAIVFVREVGSLKLDKNLGPAVPLRHQPDQYRNRQ